MADFDATSLPMARSRIGFLYVEHCRVSRKDNALTIWTENGEAHAPTAEVSALLLGPGTTITHSAVDLLAKSGVIASWVGSDSGVWYASGRPLASGTGLLTAQARIFSDRSLRLDAAKRLYARRFVGTEFGGDTLASLQSAEGAQMRAVYRDNSLRTGVKWERKAGRNAKDPVNRALNLANSCLYAACMPVICALGCSPGLGIVHEGNWHSFVLDIADIYKHTHTVPTAFDLVAENDGGHVDAKDVRRRMRDVLFTGGFLQTVVKDIFAVLKPGDAHPEVDLVDSNRWWDGT